MSKRIGLMGCGTIAQGRHIMYAELARFLETGESSLLASGEEGLRATEIALGATAQAMARRGAPP